MNKKDALKRITIEKLDWNTIHILGSGFSFSYTKADSVVKEELKGQYRYFGGLQCNYHENSPEYKNLEKWLCELAEKVLN